MRAASPGCVHSVCEEISIFQSVAARFPLTRERERETRVSCIFLPAERLRGFVKASGRKIWQMKEKKRFFIGADWRSRERISGGWQGQGRWWISLSISRKTISAHSAALGPSLVYFLAAAAIFVSQRIFQGDKWLVFICFGDAVFWFHRNNIMLRKNAKKKITSLLSDCVFEG